MFRTGDVEVTWICTCTRLAMEPGSVVVDKKFVDAVDPETNAAVGLMAVRDELIMPVTCAGLPMPSPFRKMVTVDPDAAGFEQLFCVPSALSASGCRPEVFCPRHAPTSKTGWLKAAEDKKTLG